ncbi:uncharacterized protein FMAN_06697 [Fusarium mangiferae]|uniref:Uncharacterized protein n=1 Tax=Fusarium mangiferae TaxID=192010 RepID=A0A1L7SHD4_FUSMA|nr:uncharacterized protein FMAN_06697 [Fusarium mangiferae]CVK85765.1 uncharacterized protein FMAN_06697 [Fusarium mangiferae]
MSEPTSITGPTHTHTIWRKREKKLSMTQKLVSRVTTSPEEKLKKFIMKHEIYWSNQWDNKLRLTVPLDGKSPEETLANIGALMQDEGINQYWEYVTQVHTDDPRKVDPRVDKIK